MSVHVHLHLDTPTSTHTPARLRLPLPLAVFSPPSLPPTPTGLAQADAFVSNQLEVSPSMLQVPTGLEDEPYTTSFKVAWDGPPLGAGGESVTYRVVHQPSVSIPLSDGWYGTKVRKRGAALQTKLLVS